MIKKVFIMVMSAALSVVVALHAAPAHAAVSNWQKGISIQSRYTTDFGSTTFRQSIDRAATTGVNFVTLIVPVHQDNIYSSYVYAGGDTPTDDAISSALGYIKSKGMSSAIAIHDNPYDGRWRANISAGDKDAWFASYGTLLNHYASLGQASGMSQMLIGTELSSMTVPANTNRWVALIQAVRQRFSGSLTYSAQHAGYLSDTQSLGFWPQLDKIGISAYYGLGSDGSEPALESAWAKWDQQEVSVLSAKYNKPVIFTEVGYVSRDDTARDPGTGYQLGTGLNMNAQANAYQALFGYWNNSNAVQGVMFWDWSSDPNAGGANNGDYTPQNKPAETVMKTWFNGGGTTPSTPSPSTPSTPPVAAKYTAVAAAPTGALVSKSLSLPVQVTASASVQDVLVDLEVYDSHGARVAQTYSEHQALGASAQTYTVSFTPNVADTYTLKAGVFTAGWTKNLYWNDTATSWVVSTASAPVVTPPVQTPPTTPPVTTPPVVVPPVTTPPVSSPQVSLPTVITIWWPGNTVSGVQPFKALIDGRDSSTYDLFWQVDGGVLNKLDDNSSPVAHKESQVDLTNWKWNASKQYTITFVAKDKAGNQLSQKAVVITIP